MTVFANTKRFSEIVSRNYLLNVKLYKNEKTKKRIRHCTRACKDRFAYTFQI